MSTEAAARRRAKVIGLVGRAGSGKTTFADALRARGARIIEADRIGHRVTDTDPDVRAALEDEYGPGVYRPDGTLDRGRVAESVFEDREARRRLDALVHPRLVADLRRAIAEALADPAVPLVLVDAALMLEWGLDRECDLVVAVVAPEADQIARLVAARGWSPAHARRRLEVQRSNEQFAQQADVVVSNDAGIDALLARADALFDEWTGARRARHADRG